MSTVGERLRAERERLGFSQVAFAQIGGAKKHSQINYEMDRTTPGGDYLTAILNAGADILFILTGKPLREHHKPMTFNEFMDAGVDQQLRRIAYEPLESEQRPVYTVELDNADFAAIPRVDARLAAGAGAENQDAGLEGALAFRRDWLRERDISPSDACLLKVTGDSMAPTLHDGDLVMIDERRTRIRNRHVYALIDTDGAARVKRLDHIPDQLIILASDNPAHATETRSGPDMNRLRILGEIVWSAHAW